MPPPKTYAVLSEDIDVNAGAILSGEKDLALVSEEIGGVTINSSDYDFADCDGVVIIPGDIAEEVCSRAEKLIGTKNFVIKAILEGVDPVDAYLKHG